MPLPKVKANFDVVPEVRRALKARAEAENRTMGRTLNDAIVAYVMAPQHARDMSGHVDLTLDKPFRNPPLDHEPRPGEMRTDRNTHGLTMCPICPTQYTVGFKPLGSACGDLSNGQAEPCPGRVVEWNQDAHPLATNG
jgi:hypothetical protein